MKPITFHTIIVVPKSLNGWCQVCSPAQHQRSWAQNFRFLSFCIFGMETFGQTGIYTITNAHSRMHMCTHIPIHTCINTHPRMHIYSCIHVYIHLRNKHAYTHLRTYTHTWRNLVHTYRLATMCLCNSKMIWSPYFYPSVPICQYGTKDN